MIIPCGHRLTVQPLALEDVYDEYKRAAKSGLIIPDTKDRQREQMSVDQGVVIEIGPSAFKDFGTDAWCSVGDTIAYARHAGKFIKDPDTDKDVLVINDEDVVAIIKKGA